MRPRPKKPKQQKQINLERILLNPTPEQQKPQTFYTIRAPDSFPFPIQSTLIEGIQLLQQYSPTDINRRIQQSFHIERIAKYKGKFCIQGKNKGFICDGVNLNFQSVSTFAYGPNYLVVAFENRHLMVYGLDLKLIKEFKNFSEKKIVFLKIITTPPNFEGIVLATSMGNDLSIHKLEKTFFTTLSCKLSLEVKKYKSFVMQFNQMPRNLNHYISKDIIYNETSLLAVLTQDSIEILRINYNKLNTEKFTEIIYSRIRAQSSIAYCSWSQASISSKEYDIEGDHLVLSYSFGNKFYIAVLRTVQQYFENSIKVKYEWLESKPFIVQQKQILYCTHIKKQEILLIVKPNDVLIFYTKGIDMFTDSHKSSEKEMITYSYEQELKPHRINYESEIQTYSDTFCFEYGTNQIYCIHKYNDNGKEKLGIGVYVYCNWKQICEMLKLNGNYSSSMSFLIAIYKGSNKFELGYKNNQKYRRELSEYIQNVVLEYMKNEYTKLIDTEEEEILNELDKNYSELRDILITPIQLLTTTEQFQFLFGKFKAIALKTYISNAVFYKLLEPFIRYARIKYIPQSSLQITLQYYTQADRLDLIQRLAIYFNLQKVNRSIVIDYCLNNNLTVSLAYICTQGNNSQFIIPFVELMKISQIYKKQNQFEYAQLFAIRALWYAKLCLQRGMALKDYTYEKYGEMIFILTKEFFNRQFLFGLLEIRPESCLETLSFYFSIENASIVNQFCDIKFQNEVPELKWIIFRTGNEKLEFLLQSIHYFVNQIQKKRSQKSEMLQDEQLCYLFLSKVIIYKTVKFTKEKYIEILKYLIKNFVIIKKINYGLEELPPEFSESDQMDEIYSSQYINKLLILIIYELNQRKEPFDLDQIYQTSRLVTLTELQAQISFLTNNYRNCIDIYLRGRPSSKKRIFKFLESNLKDLILEKKKKERKYLEYQLKGRIRQLISLDAIKSRNLIEMYLPESQEELIAALQNDQDLQLEYLEGVINAQLKISETSILKFVELMCKYKPNQLLQVFKKNTRLPVEQSLKICQTYSIYQCMQYLYQRVGNIEQSVMIASKRMEQIFQQKHNNMLDENELDPYIKISNILSNAIDVCVNNHNESVWESLFDSSIKLLEKFRKNKSYEEEINVLYEINAKILYNLMSYCSIQHSIWLIQQKYTSIDMGGSMKKVFIQILSNYSYNENILFTAKDLNKVNYAEFQQKHFQKFKKAYSLLNICFSCYQVLNKKENILCFFCGHIYHRDCCVYEIDEADEASHVYCINCLKLQKNQYELYFSASNPQNPKIKVDKMIEEHENLRDMTMNNMKNEQKQYIEKVEMEKTLTKVQERKKKFENYENSKSNLEMNKIKIQNDLIELSIKRQRKSSQLPEVFPQKPKPKVIYGRRNF